jgi:hypothetical protein
MDDNKTSQALKLIAKATRINRLTQLPAERTTGSFAGMCRLAERMTDALQKECDDIEKDMVLEERTVIEADSLISAIERGIL